MDDFQRRVACDGSGWCVDLVWLDFIYLIARNLLLPMRAMVTGICCLLISGCSPIAVGLYGIHPFKDATQARADRLAKRMAIKDQEYLVLSHRYKDRLQVVQDTFTKEKMRTWKGMHQPLQLRYYGKDGRLEWIVPNCDVGGFPNLRWERFGLPDTLRVYPYSRAYADSVWHVSDDFNYMTGRLSGQVPEMGLQVDGYLLVYWSYLMGRQSVRLARNINKWREHQGRRIEVRFVNVDSLMMGVDKPEAE